MVFWWLMSYAAPADLLARFDPRDVGDLCGDDGVQVSRIDLLTDPNLQACLDDASGAIDAALLAGGRYSTSDLAALTGNSLALLRRICCELALSYLWARRPLYRAEDRKAATELAEKALERLRKGENVFNVTENITASMPTIDGPTSVTYDDLNMIRDRTKNYYPARHLPYDR